MKLDRIKFGLMTGISFLALSASSVYAEQNTVKASTLLGSNVSSGATTIAQVDNMLLDKDTDQLQYLFLETLETFDQLDGRNGFVAWSDVEVEPLPELVELELVMRNGVDQ